MTLKILSLDGGGMRGVISAIILKEVETILREKKGQELHEYFDLIAGTSVGSIVAAGIACQMDADRLIQFYKDYGQDIFLESVRSQRQWRWLSQLIGNYVLYPHEWGDKGLAKVLEKNLIYQGKSPKISDIERPRLLILAYDTLSRNTTWFNTDNPADKPRWYDDIELWKICVASASAPTVFPPYELPYYDSGQTLPHIDGVVSANNPALNAIVHALFADNSDRLNLSDMAVLSIGTGKTTRPYTYQEIKQWGLLSWVLNVSEIFIDPAVENSEAMCWQILKSAGGAYLRLDFALNERFKGERQLKRLRELMENSYNKHIYQESGQIKSISEEIDNPEICNDLIEAAQCYLKHGKVSYKDQYQIKVREAIEQFIESH